MVEKDFFGFFLNSINILAEIDRQHVHDLFFLLTRIKYACVANSVSPGFRSVAFEFFDVFPKVGFLFELWVNIFF